jgi:hypothetical protein
MRYDLAMKITDGGIKPKDTEWQVGDLTADVHVTPERLAFKKITATRAITPSTRPTAPATQPAVSMFVASGALDLADKEPKLSATVSASNLQLDQAFYRILPKGTQEVWNEVKPNGTIDLTFTLAEGKDKPFTMTLRPRDLTVQPAKLPLPMDRMTGEVRVVDELLTFDNLQARSGNAAFYLDGTQRLDALDWNVKFSAREVMVTKEFLDAVPASVKAAFMSLNLRGKIALDFEKLRVVVPQPAAATTQPATTAPAGSPEIDFVASVWLDNASFDAGIPVEKAKGRFTLAASFRQDRLEKIDGSIDAYSLSMAGRQVNNFRAKLMKRPDQAGLRLDDMQADVAQGTMAGRVDLIAGDPGPSRYVMNFSLRNADIAQLTQEADPEQKIRGTLSASLSLEGAWGDAASRRGRGDVAVQGKQIVKLPLLLGLFQITNLALPITGPLSDATARYNIDGPVTTFERIELKGANLLMTGDGRLDFDKGTVRLRFNADNPGGVKIPVISELLESGTRELLQIHVKGTIEKPKVQAGTFGTISTTVDEVLGGDEKK